jgi:hypothetical protein
MTSETRYSALLETLPVITYDEFLEKDKTEDLCFEVSDEKISDDLEDYFSEQLDYVVTKEDVDNAINNAKNIIVSTKDRYKLPKNFILEAVSDYLSDNFGYDAYELGYLEDMVGGEVFDICESKINEHIKGWYTSDVIKYKLDASKEVEEYLKEELGETYPC